MSSIGGGSGKVVIKGASKYEKAPTIASQASGARQEFWIGIDPGLTGAVSVLDSAGKLVFACNMPVRARGGVVKSEISARELALVLRSYISSGAIVMVERVAARPEQGVSGMFSLGDSYGVARGVVEALGGVCVDALPVMWRKACGVSSGSGKGGAIAKARAVFGDDLVKMGWASSKKESGVADASLIAYYGWRKYLGRHTSDGGIK